MESNLRHHLHWRLDRDGESSCESHSEAKLLHPLRGGVSDICKTQMAMEVCSFLHSCLAASYKESEMIKGSLELPRDTDYAVYELYRIIHIRHNQ